MSDLRYIQLKNNAGDNFYPVIPTDNTPVSGGYKPITSGAVDASRTKYLTLSIPDIKEPLYLNIRYTENYASISEASDIIDTLSADSADKVTIFTDTEWRNITTNGITNDYANKRIMVDLSSMNSTYTIYYSWYYININTLEKVYVEPWVSTKLTATSGIPKHSELQDRNIPDAHSIESITGLTDALNRKYQEVEILTDDQMADVEVAEGKIITFVGYSNGTTSGALVMRYKDANGNFGSLVPGITATLTGTNLSLATGNATNVADDLDIYVTNDTLTVE